MRRLPAEFEEQSFIQIMFPHTNSDWADYLEEAEANFIAIIEAIIRFQDCLVICHNVAYVQSKLPASPRLHFVHYETNDTWARDCSAITVEEDGESILLDFTFTAWGGKFAYDKDNALTQVIASSYANQMKTIDFILEGGGIESNGKGTLLITSECVFNPNRNHTLSKEQSLAILKEELGVTNILCLDHGYLAGDDTDSHIDTLARFVDERTIMYLRCEDQNDEHYEALSAMEAQLKTFVDEEGKTFELIPLPFTAPVYFDDERLPATYANFLILNNAVLVPVYGDVADERALDIFRTFFKDREIVGVDCSTLIKQHGSLHCVTMQFPKAIGLS